MGAQVMLGAMYANCEGVPEQVIYEKGSSGTGKPRNRVLAAQFALGGTRECRRTPRH